MSDIQQEALPLDERLFGQIALRNGLASEAVLGQAARERMATGRPLAEILRARGVLDDAQIARVREAQRASMVVRLDSVYAEILLARGIVPRATIEQAFLEQRRRRFQTRLAELLLERRLITLEIHRAALAELQRQAQRGGLPAPPASPSPTPSGTRVRPPTERLPAIGQVVEEREASKGPPPNRAGATIPLESVASGDDKKRPTEPRDADRSPKKASQRSPLAATRELKPAKFLLENARALGVSSDGGAASSTDESSAPGDSARYLASALAVRISSDAEDGSLHFSEDDQKMIDEDCSKVDSLADKPALLLQGGTTSFGAESFSPDEYVKRKKRRRKIVVASAGAGSLALLASLLLGVGVAASHRGALAEAVALLENADRSDPASQADLYEKARARLEDARGFGVAEPRRSELAARAGAGAACARAAAALASAQPDLAQVAVRDALGLPSLAEEDRSRLRALETRARHDALLADGKKAEARGQWRRAMDCYRQANEEPAWKQMRERMKKSAASLSDAALASLAPMDRDALALALKQYYEIWSDPQLQPLLDEVDYRIALAAGRDALAKGDTGSAIRHAEDALRLHEGSKDALDLREQARRRAAVDEALSKARESEGQKRFDAALASYEAALALAPENERAAIRLSIDRVRESQKQGVAEADKSRLRREAADLVRSSDWEKLAAKARELEAARDPLARKLADFSEQAKGMVLVPAGPFVMGSDDEKIASPKRTETLAVYLIDRVEVSNADYHAFYRATACKPPSFWRENVRTKDGNEKFPSGELVKIHAKDEADHPVRCVSWQDAQAYARWKKKRLPTEAEWEKAARGNDGRTFPWGNAATVPPHVQLSKPPHVETAPRGSSDDDVSPFGIRDMGGNVSEWVEDVFSAYKGSAAQVPPGKKRVIRGGCFDSEAKLGRCFSRDGGDEDRSWPNVGFRCALDAPPWLQEFLR